MLRVTGFGQTGPYADAARVRHPRRGDERVRPPDRQPDGPPTLPPFGLADGVAGIAGAYAVLTALYHRDLRGGAGPGHRPVAAGAAARHPRPRPDRLRPTRHHRRPPRQPLAQQRPAQHLPHQRRPLGGDLGQRHLGRRTGHAPGRAADLVDEPWFSSAGERARTATCSTTPCRMDRRPRPRPRSAPSSTDVGAALAPIYDVEQLMTDPHVQARDTITTVDDEDLGPLKMQNLMFRMARHPGRIRSPAAGSARTTTPSTTTARPRRRTARRPARQGRPLMDRSYLFAPGHNAETARQVFDAGADAVILDLEDAVPPEPRPRARDGGRSAARPPGLGAGQRRAHRRRGRSRRGRGAAYGIRIPKVESAADVRWVAERAPGKPFICAIESARGVLAAQEIAAAPGVRHLAMGGVDLQRDLNTTGGNAQTPYVRSHLVICSRAAGIEPPIDSVFLRLSTTPNCGRRPSSHGRWASSASPPSTRGSCRCCTRCSPRRSGRSRGHSEVLAAFDSAGGAALRLPAASSSTCRWRSGRGGCCSWRRLCRGSWPVAVPGRNGRWGRGRGRGRGCREPLSHLAVARTPAERRATPPDASVTCGNCLRVAPSRP